MFGYRLMRDADHAALVAELAASRAETKAANDALVKALIELGEAKAIARSSQTAADHQRVEANTARMNLAQLQNRMTGVPQVVPQIQKGSPLAPVDLGAGVDMFEDVGDERAREMAEKGLLHDSPIPPFPSAAELSNVGAATATE